MSDKKVNGMLQLGGIKCNTPDVFIEKRILSIMSIKIGLE